MLKIKFLFTLILSSILFSFILGCKKPSTILSYFSNDNIEKNNQENFASVASLDFYLAGQTTGYGNLRTDGVADFGLVLKSFSKLDLFQIELNDLMSTEFDKISLIGTSIELPSNVALPNQKERYILSLTLNKPSYKLKYKTYDTQSLVLIHGQFPFEDVVKGFRNDIPLLKLADKFNMLSYSEFSFENPNSLNVMNMDILAGKNQFLDTIKISSPQQFGSDYSFVTVSLKQTLEAKPYNQTNLNFLGQYINSSSLQDQSYYLPHNLTVLSQNKSKDLKVSSRDTYLFSGLIHESFADSESTNLNRFRMSFQINHAQNWNSELLGFVDNLTYQKNHLTFTIPQTNTILPQGLFYLVYEIDAKNNENLVYQNYDLNQWQANIDLINLDSIKLPNYKYRLDLYLLGTQNSQTAKDFNELIEYSEFVTRNSIYL